MSQRIAFLGLGLMGAPMAENLIAAGQEVTVWNRTASKTDALVALGARAELTAPEAFANADVVIVMLENGPVVEDVLFDSGASGAIPSGAVVIDMSSIPPGMAKDHAGRLAARGVGHIDAPVSGGTIGAAEGTLAIMAGGETATFEKIAGVFAPLGRATHVGPSGTGQLTKLANQVICGGYLAAVAEGLVLATAGGADPAKVREALMGGFADSKVLRLHGERMVQRDFMPGGKCQIFLKDLNTVLDSAGAMSLDLPTAILIRDLYRETCDLGAGETDQAGVLLAVEARNPKARLGDGPDRRP